MAILGKRKSRDDNSASASSDAGVSALTAEEIFRRHFEAQFAPLDDEDEAARAQREQDDDDAVDSDLNGDEEGTDEDSDSDEDAWGGFDEDDEDEDDEEEEEEDEPVVQVIDHSKPQVPKEPKMSKKELRAFMVHNPLPVHANHASIANML